MSSQRDNTAVMAMLEMFNTPKHHTQGSIRTSSGPLAPAAALRDCSARRRDCGESYDRKKGSSRIDALELLSITPDTLMVSEGRLALLCRRRVGVGAECTRSPSSGL